MILKDLFTDLDTSSIQFLQMYYQHVSVVLLNSWKYKRAPK